MLTPFSPGIYMQISYLWEERNIRRYVGVNICRTSARARMEADDVIESQLDVNDNSVCAV